MKGIKTYLIALLSLFSFNCYSQNWSTYFDWTNTDSLHVYPSKIKKGEEIKLELVALTGIDTIYPNRRFFGYQSFKWSDSLTAFIVRLEDDYVHEPTIILVLANESSEIQDVIELASYSQIPGTMEETVNSWVYDIDKDGDLDIMKIIDLIDYELPIEDAPNISAVEGFLWRNLGSKFQYEYLSKELYYQLTIKK